MSAGDVFLFSVECVKLLQWVPNEGNLQICVLVFILLMLKTEKPTYLCEYGVLFRKVFFSEIYTYICWVCVSKKRLNLSNYFQVLDAAHLASCQITSVNEKSENNLGLPNQTKTERTDTLCSIYLSQYSLWKVSISNIYNIWLIFFFFFSWVCLCIFAFKQSSCGWQWSGFCLQMNFRWIIRKFILCCLKYKYKYIYEYTSDSKKVGMQFKLK